MLLCALERGDGGGQRDTAQQATTLCPGRPYAKIATELCLPLGHRMDGFPPPPTATCNTYFPRINAQPRKTTRTEGAA